MSSWAESSGASHFSLRGTMKQPRKEGHVTPHDVSALYGITQSELFLWIARIWSQEPECSWWALTFECHLVPDQPPVAVWPGNWLPLPVPETQCFTKVTSTSKPLYLCLFAFVLEEEEATKRCINRRGPFPASLMSLRERDAGLFTMFWLSCHQNLARTCRRSLWDELDNL